MLFKIKERLDRCPDTEPEQAIIRVIIVILAVSYLVWIDAFSQLPDPTTQFVFRVLAGSIIVISFLILAAIAINPVKSIPRRAFGMVVDMVFISCGIYMGGKLGAPLFVAYLWVTFGNGFRYGRTYLFCSMILNLLGLT